MKPKKTNTHTSPHACRQEKNLEVPGSPPPYDVQTWSGSCTNRSQSTPTTASSAVPETYQGTGTVAGGQHQGGGEEGGDGVEHHYLKDDATCRYITDTCRGMGKGWIHGTWPHAAVEAGLTVGACFCSKSESLARETSPVRLRS